jgi:uncharacterized repeat protein (TIGR01451 family)
MIKPLPLLLATLILAYTASGVWQVQASSFIVIGSVWGTPTTPIDAGPGDANTPLTITLQYLGATPATRIQATLSLPEGFTDSSGAANATAYTSTIPAYAIFTLTFYINIAEGVPLKDYVFHLNIRWDTASIKDLGEDHDVTVRLRGRVKLNFEALQPELSPGQVNLLPLKVGNSGTGPASDISLTAAGPPQVSILEQPRPLKGLAAQESIVIHLPIYASSTAAGAPITISLSAVYRDAYLNTRATTQGLGLYIKAPEPPFFTLSASPTTLVVGEVTSVALQLANLGASDLRGVVLSVAGTPPVALVNSDGRFYIGDVKAGEKASVQLQLYASAPAATPIPLAVTISFIDSSNTQRVEMRSLSFFTELRPRTSPFTLSIQPRTLIAGRVNNITVTATNIADYRVSGVLLTFSFTGPQVVWLEPDLVRIASLAPGESHTFEARVYNPPLASPSVLLQVSIRYYDDRNNLNQETRSIGLLSRGLIELRATDFSIIPERPAPGQVFSITVTLTNIGTITASAVTASPHPPEGFRLFGARSIFIGDMQVNTPTTFTFSLRVGNTTSPGSYQIPVELTFFDNLRNGMSISLPIPINVREPGATNPIPRQPSAGLELGWLPSYIAIGVAALIIGYLLGRRPRAK